jgi:hypothetical protein
MLSLFCSYCTCEDSNNRYNVTRQFACAYDIYNNLETIGLVERPYTKPFRDDVLAP